MLTVAALRSLLASLPDEMPVGILDPNGWCTEAQAAFVQPTVRGPHLVVELARDADSFEETHG